MVVLPSFCFPPGKSPLWGGKLPFGDDKKTKGVLLGRKEGIKKSR
jgi:hypothetical protein